MQELEYGNKTGINRDLDSPVYIDRFASFLKPHSYILEYGCNSGGLLNALKDYHFINLIGYDFSESKINQGRKLHPDLDLRILKESGKIPMQNESIDAVVLSSILCSLTEEQKQLQLIIEIFRVLKKHGILYLSDFLINHDEFHKEKYKIGFKEYGEWGLYTTDDKLLVRHHSTKAIMSLLNNFDIQWFEQFDFKIMNQNPTRTFHCIAQKN